MAARGSAARQLLAAGGLHSLLPHGAKVLLLHLSVLPERFVLHQCAAPRDTCRHGFISGPSLSSRLPGERHFLLYVPVAQGCQARRCPCCPRCPVGLLNAEAAPVLRWSATAIGSVPGGTAGRSPSGCCCGSQEGWEGVKSTDKPKLNVLLLL